MLDAANKIAFDPYIYGGGHASFNAAGYDCSGSVSYVLHAGGLLATPLDSEQFLQVRPLGQRQLDHDLHERSRRMRTWRSPVCGSTPRRRPR